MENLRISVSEWTYQIFYDDLRVRTSELPILKSSNECGRNVFHANRAPKPPLPNLFLL